MGYALREKIQGIKAGTAGRGPLRPLINPRMAGTRAALMFPGLRPMINPRYVGDPGFLGSIGKFVGGIAKKAVGTAFRASPLGQAYNAVREGVEFVQRVGAPQSRSLPSGGVAMLPPPQTMFQPPIPFGGGGGIPEEEMGPGPTVPAENTAVVTRHDGSHALVPTSGNVCAIKGYHLNKSGYYVNSSVLLPGAHYVAPGTMCVKNRRMNPFNPRAASKAMHRLQSLANGMKGMKKAIGKLSRAAGVHQAPRKAPKRRAS